jgi:hypothetical protein
MENCKAEIGEQCKLAGGEAMQSSRGPDSARQMWTSHARQRKARQCIGGGAMQDSRRRGNVRQQEIGHSVQGSRCRAIIGSRRRDNARQQDVGKCKV